MTDFPVISSAMKSPSILKWLTGSKAFISRSRSAMRRTATLCTRPALRLFLLVLIFRHRTGLNSNPTMRSSTRRACCAITRSILTVRGFFTAASIAGFVISWKTIRLVVIGSRPSTSHRCQLIASPSRSSSVASQTSSDLFAKDFNSLTTFFFSSGTI